MEEMYEKQSFFGDVADLHPRFLRFAICHRHRATDGARRHYYPDMVVMGSRPHGLLPTPY
jgi:hypothetical protein